LRGLALEARRRAEVPGDEALLRHRAPRAVQERIDVPARVAAALGRRDLLDDHRRRRAAGLLLAPREPGLAARQRALALGDLGLALRDRLLARAHARLARRDQRRRVARRRDLRERRLDARADRVELGVLALELLLEIRLLPREL